MIAKRLSADAALTEQIEKINREAFPPEEYMPISEMLEVQARGEFDVLALLDGLHREGRTILLITHSPAVAACAQQQIVVSNGVLQGRLYWEDVQGAHLVQ